jgi:hypothetical protein
MAYQHALEREQPEGRVRRRGHLALDRLREIDTELKLRRLSQIGQLLADFDYSAKVLELEIEAEHQRVRINDPAHFAYSTYAKSAIHRRENLLRSAKELMQTAEALRASINSPEEDSRL